MITHRFVVTSLIECPKCGGVILGLQQMPGAPNDPIEKRPPQAQQLDPNDYIQPETPEEAIFQGIQKNLQKMFPGATIMGGSALRGLSRDKSHESGEWSIEITREEYDTIGPLTLGSVLVRTWDIVKR